MTTDDYQQLFFATIGRAPGQPADDYALVLGASGIPAGYGPGVMPNASMPFAAMTQQIGTDGRIAGRIFLPTATPDPNGYYTHPFSPLRDGPTAGSLLWEWRDLGGPPVVTPGADSSGPPPEPITGGLTEAQVQAMLDQQTAQLIAHVTAETERVLQRLNELRQEVIDFAEIAGKVLLVAHRRDQRPDEAES